MEEFGLAKETWLRQFLELPNSVPSHVTFGPVLARLNPQAFQQCFLNCAQAVAEVTSQEIISIDGKKLRRSHDRSNGQRAIEWINAWTRTNRLMLGQVKVDDISNVITAAPHLLRLLGLDAGIVTGDALDCQKQIAVKILQQEVNYVLALKGGYPTSTKTSQASSMPQSMSAPLVMRLAGTTT
jgi:Transposase